MSPQTSQMPGVRRLRDLPFNISLLIPDRGMIRTLRPTKVIDIYDQSGVNFHDDGLYSVSTFGRVGTEDRDRVFSYIDLKTQILHPEIFYNLVQLKGLYGEIMASQKYAYFDEELKDFVAADAITGETGYGFFMSHWKKTQFKRTNSDLRDLRIEFIEKYKEHSAIGQLLVMPAGLRDIEITDLGQTREDDINAFYKKMISAANAISDSNVDQNISIYDVPRWTMQRVINQLYDYILLTIKGKQGWFQRKWGSRNTINGTRNVVTAMDTSVPYLDSPDAIEVSDTLIGFSQVLRGALPFTLHGLNRGILGQTFGVEADQVLLTNRKTLKAEYVDVTFELQDRYMSRQGVEKFVNKFYLPKLRNRAVVIEDRYLGLMYEDDNFFKVFKDIDDLPEGFSRKNVKPLTLSDVLYTSTYDLYRKLVGTVTRYPITGTGSIYPTFYKVRTTEKSSKKTPLDDQWQPIESETVHNFPDRGPNPIWLESLVPHITRIAGLSMDFDGDTGSSPILYSEEAQNEVTAFYKRAASYITADKKLITSANNDTVALVVANLTGAPKRAPRP